MVHNMKLNQITLAVYNATKVHARKDCHVAKNMGLRGIVACRKSHDLESQGC